MARKLRPAEEVIRKIERKIEASKDTWYENTVEGFRTDWNEWYGGFVRPVLARLIPRLPKKTADIKTNLLNRSYPVCRAISEVSARYRAKKMAEAERVPERAIIEVTE